MNWVPCLETSTLVKKMGWSKAEGIAGKKMTFIFQFSDLLSVL